MKIKLSVWYVLLFALTVSSHLFAMCCPKAVVCNSNSIHSCYAVDSYIPICNDIRKKHCWNAIKLSFGKLSHINSYDRPPLNTMCYYLNDGGLYSIILDYVGDRAYKWAI